MAKAAVIARLTRLERQKQAENTKKPTLAEMMAEAAGQPVRPVVAQAAALLRELARRCDPWHEA